MAGFEPFAPAQRLDQRKSECLAPDCRTKEAAMGAWTILLLLLLGRCAIAALAS
jgi:hypothetical protein